MALTPVKEKEILYLTRADVQKVNMTMAECIDVMEQVYREKGNGTIIFPPKHPMNIMEDGACTAMPAYLQGMNCAGTKVITGYAQNPPKGYAYIHGLYNLFDPETGIPVAVMDCIELTAIRTGAVTGLGAKYMANADSESVFFYGAGTQARMGLAGYMCVLPNINRVYVADISEAAIERYKADMEAMYPQIKVIPVHADNLEEAVRDSDILNSCIPTTHSTDYQVIRKEWLKPNMTNMPVEAGLTYFPDVLDPALYACTVTDDLGQHLHFQEDGFMAMATTEPTELGDIVAGKKPGRQSHDERILTLLNGTGLADLGAAKFIYDKAIREGIGTILPL